MDERYVKGEELAMMMGVSEQTIKRMTKAGMPSYTWGMRIRRYLPSQAFAWAQNREPNTITVNQTPSSKSQLLVVPERQRRR